MSLEAIGLRKRFGARVALDGAGFRAEDGAITGLLGPNGAGKSTSLRILCALVDADDGEARIDEEIVDRALASQRLRLGVLPHSAGLYGSLTARENIEYFGRLCGLPGKEARRRAAELIALLEIDAIADRRAKGFSQGERMKTALARALVHAPRNLVLDEPTNGLDVPSVRKLRALLSKLREAGHCILFSSHVMHEVATLCDQVVVIAGGRVVASGTPASLRDATGAADFEEAFVRLTGGDAEEPR